MDSNHVDMYLNNRITYAILPNGVIAMYTVATDTISIDVGNFLSFVKGQIGKSFDAVTA